MKTKFLSIEVINLKATAQLTNQSTCTWAAHTHNKSERATMTLTSPRGRLRSLILTLYLLWGGFWVVFSAYLFLFIQSTFSSNMRVLKQTLRIKAETNKSYILITHQQLIKNLFIRAISTGRWAFWRKQKEGRNVEFLLRQHITIDRASATTAIPPKGRVVSLIWWCLRSWRLWMFIGGTNCLPSDDPPLMRGLISLKDHQSRRNIQYGDHS